MVRLISLHNAACHDRVNQCVNTGVPCAQPIPFSGLFVAANQRDADDAMQNHDQRVLLDEANETSRRNQSTMREAARSSSFRYLSYPWSYGDGATALALTRA
jgi:hypothetical protein